MTEDDDNESILPPDDFNIEPEEKTKKRRKGPTLRKKQRPFEPGEMEAAIAAFHAKGGKVQVIPMVGEANGALRMRGKNVANRSLVEIADAARSTRIEDRDFLS